MSTAAALHHSPLTEHRCVSVTCTSCHEPFDDDFTHHFASITEALQVVRSADWSITDTTVTCPACALSDLDTSSLPLSTLQACEFCCPPLFGADPECTQCRCDDPAATTTHILGPLLATTICPDRGFSMHFCVTAHCTDCGDTLGDNEESTPHFPTPDQARAQAVHAGWLVAEGLLLICRRCAERRACTVLGHSWPEQPSFTTPAGVEHRYCSRDCGESVTSPAGHPWL
ncbi:MAG: hypothetical protein AB7G47_19775 [Mycolicibacterium sp.]|uniref:hypothetical protein n=1 Tax=Mycolicibacterium sp. TaxID=2320850 RepID=UPI003D11ACAD